MLFRFDRRPEVVKARIGDAKLQRILQNQPGFANVNEMVKLIAEEDDLVREGQGLLGWLKNASGMAENTGAGAGSSGRGGFRWPAQ